MATTLYVGTGGYASINAAIDAAAKIEGAVTIEIAAGTYAEDIALDARYRIQTGDLVFKAAAGAEVTLTGTVTLGYREKGVGATMWNSDIAFEGITFDQAAAETHSIDVQDVKSLTLTNCTIIGDGEYGIGSASGNGTGPSLIQNCTFTNASIQGLGNFCTGLVIDKCTFNDSRINIQAGNLVTVQNSTFNCSLTDANVSDSFYCIRSNDDAIKVTGCTFNIDSKLAEVAENQEEWAIIWQRKDGNRKWEVSNITVNLTEAAMAQTELLLNKNATSTEANEAGRVTITGLTSSSNDVAALLGRSEGIVNAVSGGKWMIYDDGDLKSTMSAETLYVSANYTTSNVPAGTLFGFDAFSSFTEAIQSVTADTTTIKLDSDIKEIMPDDVEIMASGNLLITADKKVKLEFSNKGTACDFVLDAVAGKSGSKIIFGANIDFAITDRLIYNGYYNNGVSVDIYGNVAGYQWWNGADTTVYAGGTLSTTGEAMVFRRNKTLTVVGNAAQGAAKEDRVWQVNANYYQILSGKVVATDAYLKGGSIWIGGSAGHYGEGASLLNISNTVWESSGNMTLDNGVFNVTKGSSLVVGLQDGWGISNVSATGELNITDSSFESMGIVNNGTITVSGTSTLNIASLSGDKAIKIADGAVIKDTTINGGTVALDGTATFEGVNSVGSFSLGYYNHKLIIGTDGSLTVNSGRVTLSYGNTIDIDGTIENAKTADKTALTKSLDIKEGFSFAGNGTYGGKDATLNVDNAYVSFGSSTSKNKNANGKFYFNFTNSIVDFTADFQTALPTEAGLDPYFYLNVTNSVFTVGTRFAFNHEHSFAVIDNSVVTIVDQFRNAGEFTLQNGSTMTVGGNADGSAYSKTGNFGTLTVTGTGTLFDFTAAASSGYPFYNAGTVVVAAGAEFKAGSHVKNLGTIEINGGNFTAANVSNEGEGTINISGTSTVNIDLIKGNDINVSGTLKNSNIAFEVFDWETGNMQVDGEVIIDGGSFKNAQFRAGADEKITVNNTVTAAGALQLKAVNGAIVVNGTFDGSGSTIEIEGTGATLTVAKGAVVDIAEVFYLNGGTTTINGNLAANADLAALKKEDAQVKSAYATWGGAYAANITLNDTYVWNSMISINNADTVVTLNNSRLTGWMSFDITGGKVVANGSYIDHQAAEGWAGPIIGAAGALKLQDGSAFVAAKGIENNGTITISADSFFSAKSLTNNGTITIDAKDFAFAAGETYVKVIDLTQNSALTNVELVNGTGFGLAFAADGDVYLAAASTAYLNAGWAGSEVGDVLAGGYVYGLNAFSSFEEIFGGAVSAETTKLVIAGGTYSSLFNTTTGVSIMSGLSAVEASGEVVVDLGSLVFGTEVAGDVYVTGNFTTTDTNTWSTEHGLQPYYNGAIQFKGTENTTFNIGGIFNAAEGFSFDTGKAIISADSVLTVNNQHCGQINVYGDVVSYGAMSVDLQVGSTLRLVNIGNQGKLTLSGAKASLNTNIIKDQPWAGAQCVDFYISNGSLVVEKGATVNATGIVEVYADSSITVDSSSFTAGIVDNKAGSVTVSGASTINIGTLTGNIDITADATLTNSNIAGGNVNVGFNVENAADTTLTLVDTTIKTLYVGRDGSEIKYGLKVAGEGNEVTLNNLYTRNGSVVTVSEGAVLNVGYWNCKGSATIDGATVNHTGVNFYIYNNDTADVATITVTNGGKLTSNANYAIYLGNSENGPAKGNAAIVLEGGSTLEVKNLILHAEGVIEDMPEKKAETSVTLSTGSSINAVGTITNNGVINMDVTSTIIADEIKGDGSINITINTKQLTTGYTLINQTGVDAALDITKINVTIDGIESTLANLFGEDVFAVIDDGYVLMKSDNDLVVSSVNTLYVSSDLAATAAGTVITVNGGQYVVGVNAFGSLAGISGKVSEAPCKVIYDYAADLNAGETGNAGIIVTVKNDGTSLVSYNVNGEYHNFYSNRTHEIAFESTGTQTVEFTFTNGDFSFESSLVASNGAAEVVTPDGNGILVSDKKVAVDEIAGDKSYIFTVDNALGDFECALSGITGTGEIAIYALNSDGTRGELVANRLFNRDTTFGVDKLAKGSYEVVFSGYGYNAEAGFSANMTLDEYAVSANHADDTLEGANGVAFGVELSGDLGKVTEADRGEVDTVDWIQFTGLTAGERIGIDFTVTGAPVSVSLYDGNNNLVANFYVYDKQTSGIDYTRYVAPGTDNLFARVSSTGVAEYAVTTSAIA